jgi:hypothetical protein
MQVNDDKGRSIDVYVNDECKTCTFGDLNLGVDGEGRTDITVRERGGRWFDHNGHRDAVSVVVPELPEIHPNRGRRAYSQSSCVCSRRLLLFVPACCGSGRPSPATPGPTPSPTPSRAPMPTTSRSRRAPPGPSVDLYTG